MKLRYIITTITVFLMFFAQVSAQFRLGVTGGAVLSSLIRDSNLNARESRFGFLVGTEVRYVPGELGWNFRTGVNYSTEGDSDQHLNFIKVPLTIGLDFSEDVGMYVSYNFAWQMSDHNNAKENYKDFGNILGLGVEVYLGERFAMGPRLNYGLSNMVAAPAGAKNFNVKPFTLDLYLTYFVF